MIAVGSKKGRTPFSLGASGKRGTTPFRFRNRGRRNRGDMTKLFGVLTVLCSDDTALSCVLLKLLITGAIP